MNSIGFTDDDVRVCKLLRHVRQRYDHHTYVSVLIYKPLCHGCKHHESRFMERDTPIPDVFPENWEEDYQWYDITRYRIRVIKKLMREGTWDGPDCYHCGTLLGLEGDEPFYVNSGMLDDYFRSHLHRGRKPRQWMKDILFEVYNERYAACRKKLTKRSVTYDHIIPRQHDGETALDNLQPLCRRCNQKKGQ